MSDNLWPNFEVSRSPRTPKAIIEEAGHGLAEKTRNLIQFYTFNTSMKDNKLHLEFSLYVVNLTYHFPFMRATFNIETLYPVYLIADKLDEASAKTEEELTALLERIFKSPSTIDTVQRLLALSQA